MAEREVYPYREWKFEAYVDDVARVEVTVFAGDYRQALNKAKGLYSEISSERMYPFERMYQDSDVRLLSVCDY